MVWLNTTTQAGQGLYLDIWKRERSNDRNHLELVSGVLGDGHYEGEVLVEVSPQGCELTFVDQVLDPEALRCFFARVDREELLKDLENILAEEWDGMSHGRPSFRRDIPARDGCDPAVHEPLVREAAAPWRSDPPRACIG